jgi:asparagine synthase (glutamine-hydrolysing)
MCGVFVVYSKNGNSLSKTQCLNASDKLYNRGPDSLKYSFFRKNTLFISNTVLSITGKIFTDKSLSVSKNKNYTLSFNGEIYNYKTLGNNYRSTIVDKNTTDSKVLADLYDIVDYQSIPKILNGMFAYVVYDKREQRLIIVNDPQGEKNLYYYENKNFFLVSSTTEAINSFLKEKNLNINPLRNYLFTRHYMALKETSFKDIYLFSNASNSVYEFHNNKLKINKYEDPIDWISEKKYMKFMKLPEEEVIDYLDFKLNEQAKIMIPNQKFGCVVSGGVDSTLQAYLINQYSTSKINLVVDHKNKDPIVNKISNFDPYFLSKIKKIEMNSKKYRQLSNKCYKTVASPWQTHDLPSRMLLSSYFRKNNCKVFFSADGCDELFGGQQIYEKVFKNKYDYKKNFSPYSTMTNLFNLPKIFLDKSYESSIDSNWQRVLKNYNFIVDPKSKNIQSSLFLDYFLQSIAVANRSNDLICCENSVEPRNLFIQKNILKIIINLPLKYKINFTQKDPLLRQKYILKKIFLKYFDKKLLFKKSGFSGFPSSIKIKGSNSIISNLFGLKKHIPQSKFYYDKKNFSRDYQWKLTNIAIFLDVFNIKLKF